MREPCVKQKEFAGPDAQETMRIAVENHTLSFFASELRLRGDAYIAQPHRDDDGNILCWNGEVGFPLQTTPVSVLISA